ncbi:MAG: hypothetical protein Kow00105_13550 [Phycisphaeraceae bacterium]
MNQAPDAILNKESPGRYSWAVPFVLAVAGALVYLNALSATFVLDDHPWILLNPRIRDLGNIAEILTATNRPVLELTLALNYAIGGNNPAVYHATNIAIHVFAGLVLYGLVRRTLLLPVFHRRFNRSAAIGLAATISLLWLVHPLNTQAVTYTIQRGESLMGLCYLLTIYGLVRYATSGNLLWAVIAVVACWIGAGVKEVIATAPLLALLYDHTFLQSSWKQIIRQRGWFYLALCLMWVPLAWMLSRGLGSDETSAGLAMREQMLSPLTYLLSQPQIILEIYLRKAFWPVPLVFDYAWVPAIPEDTPRDQWWTLFQENVLWQGVLLSFLFMFSLLGIVRRAWWGVTGVAFFLILAPTSSFMPIADLAVEHRMYLPLIPVITLSVVTVYWILHKCVPARNTVFGFLLAFVAACSLGLQTVARNYDYHSRITLWSSVVEVRPNNARAWHNLAAALNDEGHWDQAIACYEQVLKILPTFSEAHYGLGTIYLEHGNYDSAIHHLRLAIEQRPEDAAYHAQLGKALMLNLQLDEAEASLRHAIALNPDDGRAYEYLGLLRLAQKKPEEALDWFRQGVEHDPALMSNYHNLAAALAGLGRYTEAVQVIEKAIRLAVDLELPKEELESLESRLSRYRQQADQAPAGP